MLNFTHLFYAHQNLTISLIVLSRNNIFLSCFVFEMFPGWYVYTTYLTRKRLLTVVRNVLFVLLILHLINIYLHLSRMYLQYPYLYLQKCVLT